MMRRPPRSTLDRSSAASDVYKRQPDGQPDRVARIILDAAESLGWPVLADPLSGLRLDQPTVVPNFDPMLRSAAVAAALLPEVVVRLGGLVSSKVTGQWLSAVPRPGPYTPLAPPARDLRADSVGRVPFKNKNTVIQKYSAKIKQKKTISI